MIDDSLALAVQPSPNGALAKQADSDQQLIDVWLHGRGVKHGRGLPHGDQAVPCVRGQAAGNGTLADLQAYDDSLAYLAPASRSRALAAVKSLFAFGHRLGMFPVDVAHALRLPPRRDTLAERILSEADVHRMLALKVNPWNHAMLRFLYYSGTRVSELTGLRWRDIAEREDGGQITVLGKGA